MTSSYIYQQSARVLRLSLYAELLDHYLDHNMIDKFHSVSEKMRALIAEIEANA